MTERRDGDDEARLTHLDGEGKARMVDVSGKEPTRRKAVARARVVLGEEAFRAVNEGKVAKGDVLSVARLAGIQAAKRTSEWIPLCHPLPLEHLEARVARELDADRDHPERRRLHPKVDRVETFEPQLQAHLGRPGLFAGEHHRSLELLDLVVHQAPVAVLHFTAERRGRFATAHVREDDTFHDWGLHPRFLIPFLIRILIQPLRGMSIDAEARRCKTPGL